MGKRRSEIRPFISIPALIACLVALAVSMLLTPGASAGPLDGVTGPVDEATAPVNEAVETVVPPPAPAPAPTPAPPPVEPPPPVKAPEAAPPPAPAEIPSAPPTAPEVKLPPAKAPAPPDTKVPSAPKVPSAQATETVKQPVDTATGTATNDAGNATSTGKVASDQVGAAAGGATDTVQKTTTAAGDTGQRSGGAATGTPRGGGGTGATQSTDSATVLRGDSSAGTGSSIRGRAGEGTAAASGPVLGLSPAARLLRPFIYVWPAVALTGERLVVALTGGPLLGGFVASWARSVLALFEEHGIGSPQGAAPALAGPVTGDTVSASDDSDQPPFSWFTSPGIAPFNWVGSESLLVVLALFLVAGTSTLLIFALARHEIGLPMFRRGNRFPWRH